MKNTDIPTDRTPLILPRLVSRGISPDNGEGNPRTSNITKYMTPFVIVVALERFTYYSLVVNLFIFFNYDVYQHDHEEKSNGPFNNGPTDAIVSVMVLIGLSWMFCVLGGWISDARLGKLKTIIWGLVIYALGTGLLLLSAYLVKHQLIYKSKKSYRALVVFASIVVALVGEGAYKANIAAFGAEQLDHKDPVSTRRYFNFYYISLNIGVLFACISAYIQQWKGFVIGFALPFGSITLALIIFVLSRKRYKILPCQRIVGKAYQIIKEARRKCKRSSGRYEKISCPSELPENRCPCLKLMSLYFK